MSQFDGKMYFPLTLGRNQKRLCFMLKLQTLAYLQLKVFLFLQALEGDPNDTPECGS